ncbi:carboxymuconolactone decarboxylase family protein [Kribbella sp. DT2]|uniref:carboxymuconolactone decarboxylase family protein n=1 Tax=Kribbella sp. DT2 TaxID=3393427 RepID=UPI003CEEA3E4
MEARFNLFESPTAAKVAKRIYSVAGVLEQSTVPKALQEILALRASQINGCAFCVDMHTKDATAAGESQQRLHLVAVWREATVFTEAERAALALTEEGTRLADAFEGVSDETWSAVRKHFTDDEVGALICMIALINAANRMNVIVQNPAGAYEPGTAAALIS